MRSTTEKLMFRARKLFYVSCKTLGVLKRLCCDSQEIVFISLVYISLYKSFTDYLLHSKNNGMNEIPDGKKIMPSKLHDTTKPVITKNIIRTLGCMLRVYRYLRTLSESRQVNSLTYHNT